MPARHKGIHTDAYLDQFWPHHAVIPWENCCEKNYDPAHSRAHEMACAERHAFIRRGDKEYLAFRFKSRSRRSGWLRSLAVRSTMRSIAAKAVAGRSGAGR